MTAHPTIAETWPGLCARLFAVLRGLLARALPAPLAAGKAFLTRAELRAVRAWIRPLETAARILIVAAALALPGLPPKPERRSQGQWGSGGGSWGARERSGGLPLLILGPSGGRSGGGPRVAPGRRPALHDPAALHAVGPIIARIEVVCGVIADPLPHIRRAARRLRRDSRRLSGGSGGPAGTRPPHDLSEIIGRAAAPSRAPRVRRRDTS
jgi:hypothetical protein